MSAVIVPFAEASAIRDQHVFGRALAKARSYGYGKVVQVALTNEVRAQVRGGATEADAVRRCIKPMSAPVNPRGAA